MQSSGGLADVAARGRARRARPCSAGPPAAPPRRRSSRRRQASRDLLCFDMGGTSCDVCVVEDGAVRETAGREVGGRPLALPMVDIHTVGAGGGSIAWRDAGGALRVGPALGRRRARTRLLRARRHRADRHRREPRARPARREPPDRAACSSTSTPRAPRSAGSPAQLGLGVDECALGIVRVANAEMVRALRVMTVERGLDPRAFALLAFGGAGPLHAAELADELGITRILVPPASGVLSALGLAAADRRTQVAAHACCCAATRSPTARSRTPSRSCGRRRRARRGRLRHALPRPVARADGSRRAAQPTSCARRSPRCTRSATATATTTSDVELVTVRVTGVDPGPRVELRADDAELSLFVPDGLAPASRPAHGDGARGRAWTPVELQVVTGALRAACEEMGAALVRSAHSANIKERRDCSTALFDPRGEMVMQAEHIPVHLGAMPAAVGGRRRRGPSRRRVVGAQRPVPRRHAPARHHGHHARLRRRRADRLRGLARPPRRRRRARSPARCRPTRRRSTRRAS